MGKRIYRRMRTLLRLQRKSRRNKRQTKHRNNRNNRRKPQQTKRKTKRTHAHNRRQPRARRKSTSGPLPKHRTNNTKHKRDRIPRKPKKQIRDKLWKLNATRTNKQRTDKMVKTQQEQGKASDVFTANIHNLLIELKQAYAQYSDVLSEMNAKGKYAEENYDDQDKQKTLRASQIIRQTITMLELEIKTLENIGRLKTSKELGTIRKQWKEMKSYMPEPELVQNYLIELNTVLTNQILNKVYTDIDGIYS